MDDSEIVRADLKEKLEDCGLRVAGTASNGLGALRHIKSHGADVDLVTLDIIMPVMDGIECFKRLRNSGFAKPCLIISYLAREASVPTAFGETIAPELFLAKPLYATELERRLHFAFSPHQKKPEAPTPTPEMNAAQA